MLIEIKERKHKVHLGVRDSNNVLSSNSNLFTTQEEFTVCFT